MATPGTAGYKIETDVLPEAREIKTLAVLPTVCASGVDCLWVERKLEQDLAKSGHRITLSAAQVRRVMLEFGEPRLIDLDADDLSALYRNLADRFGVDAMILPAIPRAGTKLTGGVDPSYDYLYAGQLADAVPVERTVGR